MVLSTMQRGISSASYGSVLRTPGPLRRGLSLLSSSPRRMSRCSRRLPVCPAARRSYEPDPVLDEPCPVPREQQPMQEYKQLEEAFLFDWAKLPLPEFLLRLGGVWGAFMVVLGLPVSVVTFDLASQPAECLVAASLGSLFLVTVMVLRLYLGYDHVGSRLLSATVVYEESGWYDGQVWIKTPAMLSRDRLLGIYNVKPALQRLKGTLYSLTGAMVLSTVFLAFSSPSEAQQPSAAADDSYYTGAAQAQRDYWDAVSEYEPWALEEGSAAAAGGEEGEQGLLAQRRGAHLLGSGEVVRY